MIIIGTIIAGIKTAANEFQKLSEKERLAALAQAQFLDDAAVDFLEFTEEYKKNGRLDPYCVGKIVASAEIAAKFIEDTEIKKQTNAAKTLINEAYKLQSSNQQHSLKDEDIEKIRELAGGLKGMSRVIHAVAEAGKHSGGLFK